MKSIFLRSSLLDAPGRTPGLEKKTEMLIGKIELNLQRWIRLYLTPNKGNDLNVKIKNKETLKVTHPTIV